MYIIDKYNIQKNKINGQITTLHDPWLLVALPIFPIGDAASLLSAVSIRIGWFPVLTDRVLSYDNVRLLLQ